MNKLILLLSLFLSTQSFASESHVTHVLFKEKDQLSPFSIDIIKSNHDYVSYVLKMDGEFIKKISPLPKSFKSITDHASSIASFNGWATGAKIGTTVVGGAAGFFVSLFVGFGRDSAQWMVIPITAVGAVAGYFFGAAQFYSVDEDHVVSTLMSSKVINSNKPVVLEYDAMEAVSLIDRELNGI